MRNTDQHLNVTNKLQRFQETSSVTYSKQLWPNNYHLKYIKRCKLSKYLEQLFLIQYFKASNHQNINFVYKMRTILKKNDCKVKPTFV